MRELGIRESRQSIARLEGVSPAVIDVGDTLAAPPPTDGGTTTSSLKGVHTSAHDELASQMTANIGLASPKLSVTAAASISQSGVARWAVANANLSGDNWIGFWDNDCTDFVSRALHFGGGLSERYPTNGKWMAHDNNRSLWFDRTVPHFGHYYSKTWSLAPWSFTYQFSRGASTALKSAVRVGDIAYVNEAGWSEVGINHAGIVSKVVGGNVYVAQMSDYYQYRPIYKTHGGASWQSNNPDMTVFFVDTSAER